jgi:hypothetical protein
MRAIHLHVSASAFRFAVGRLDLSNYVGSVMESYPIALSAPFLNNNVHTLPRP